MSQTPVPGDNLGSYRIESVLGSGAMGVVYRATYEKTGRAAAVKVISGEIAQGEKVRKRFEREYEILNQFRHPNIVRLLAWGKFRGTRYIAMEFVEGVTLEKILQERGALPWREVVDLGIQVCDALHYAHERGIVHRDLKPSNLMVTPDGKVKLTDFGIAKDLDPDATPLTATGRTLGTAAYMAPEQIRGTPAVSHKTDLYALGIVFYQMLAGKPPFEGGTPVVLMHYHLNEPPPRPSAKVAEIPRALDDLVVTLMAKGPADRPWDAAAAQVTLTALRDKAERGEAIPMVWPSTSGTSKGQRAAGGASGGAATGSITTERTRRKSKKPRSLVTLASAIFPTRSRTVGDGPGFAGLSRSAIETMLLLLALVGIGGFIVYRIWPPGQEYLYRQAKPLMESDRRSDWITARDEYLDDLDRRFPQNPYREASQKLRDKILLDEAKGRAETLSANVKLRGINEPNNDGERQFVIYNALADEASRRKDDLTAVQHWREMAARIKPKAEDPKTAEPEERQEKRKWYLLAMYRAEQLDNAIRDRRQYAEKQLQMAEEAFRKNHPEQAFLIRGKLIEQYGGFTDLADLLPAAPAQAAPASGSQPGSPGQPAAPERPAAPASKTASEDKPNRPEPATEAGAPSSPKSASPPSSGERRPPPDSESSSEVDQHSSSQFRS
jgi:serine/threonine-protein kinase